MSTRSVGSTGSQGSARGAYLQGETRFPTATSYVSDTQRSDVATVCSGSVFEDIEVESIISADLNVQSAANPPSPPSSVKMALGPAHVRSTISQSSSNDQQQSTDTVVPPKSSPVQALQPDQGPTSALYNNMGPPLARSFLLQHPQHPHTEGNSSWAGSVRSFESSACSDVVAHVDTDDCGGSLDMDVHSVHSQEDVAHSEGTDPNKTNLRNKAEEEHGRETVNPLFCSNESNANGRTSPGGTIYKGRGNRRYQGRYMHLPLKRFHQNGVDLGDEPPPTDACGGVSVEEAFRVPPTLKQPIPPQRPHGNGGWGTAKINQWGGIRSRSRSRSPDRQCRHDIKTRDRFHLNGSRPRSRSGSRSRSRSRSRDRERDRNHNHDHMPPQHYNCYDDGKRGERRWRHNGEICSSASASFRYRGHNRSRGERSGHSRDPTGPTGGGGQGSNRSRRLY